MMKRFLYYYLRSMRLYYCFVTGTTTLYGVSWWGFQKLSSSGTIRRSEWISVALVLCIGFLSWGVNQIFSDYCDRREDAVNAPHRPMVTGALPARPAMMLSGVIMLAFGVVAYCLNPWCLAILAVGGLLNIAYSICKKIPVLNCLIYACAISCCALFSYSALEGGLPPWNLIQNVLLYVLPAHFLMCHNSYYKDVEGDRLAGIRTLQVIFPKRLSVVVSLTGTLITYGYLFMFFSAGAARPLGNNLLLGTLQTALVTVLLIQLLRSIVRNTYHRTTCLNCQFCVAMIFSSMMIFFPFGLYLEVMSLVEIGILFNWYRDEKE